MPDFSATQLRNRYSSFQDKANLVLQKTTASSPEQYFDRQCLLSTGSEESLDNTEPQMRQKLSAKWPQMIVNNYWCRRHFGQGKSGDVAERRASKP